jgi:hypothetical protein
MKLKKQDPKRTRKKSAKQEFLKRNARVRFPSLKKRETPMKKNRAVTRSSAFPKTTRRRQSARGGSRPESSPRSVRQRSK